MGEIALPPGLTNDGQPDLDSAWDAAHASHHLRSSLVDNREDLTEAEAGFIAAKADAIEESRLKKNHALVKIKEVDMVAIAKLKGDIALMGEAEEQKNTLVLSEENTKLIDRENKLRTGWLSPYRSLRRKGFKHPPYDKELLTKLLEETGGALVEQMMKEIGSDGSLSAQNRQFVFSVLEEAGKRFNEGIKDDVEARTSLHWDNHSRNLWDSNVASKEPDDLIKRMRNLGKSIAAVSRGDYASLPLILQLMHADHAAVFHLSEHDLAFLSEIAGPAHGVKETKKSRVSSPLSELDDELLKRGIIYDQLEGYKRVRQLAQNAEA